MKEIPPVKLAGFAQLERRVPYTIYIHKMPAVIVERTRLLIPRMSDVVLYVLYYCTPLPIDTDRYHSTREKVVSEGEKN